MNQRNQFIFVVVFMSAVLGLAKVSKAEGTIEVTFGEYDFPYSEDTEEYMTESERWKNKYLEEKLKHDHLEVVYNSLLKERIKKVDCGDTFLKNLRK